MARKTPLKKPNRGEAIVSRKPRPKSAYDFLGLLYCFIVLLCICVVSCPICDIFPTVMVRYSLFILKMLLNPKQTNRQTIRINTQMGPQKFNSLLLVDSLACCVSASSVMVAQDRDHVQQIIRTEESVY